MLVLLLVFSACGPASPRPADEATAWLDAVDGTVERASRIAALWRLNDRYNENTKDSAQLLLAHLELHAQNGDTLTQAFLRFQRLTYYQFKQDTLPEDALRQEARWLIDHYDTYQAPDILAIAHLNILWSYAREGKYATAAAFIKAQQAKWPLFSPRRQGQIRETATVLMIENGNYAKALLQLEQALLLDDSIVGAYYTASLHTYFGDVFNQLDLPDLAAAYHRKALAKFMSIPEDHQLEDHNNYVIEQKILTATTEEEALQHYQRGKTTTDKTRPQDHPTCLEFCLWTYYSQREEHAKAEKYLQLIIDYKTAKREVGGALIEQSKMLVHLNRQGRYAEAIALGTRIEAALAAMESKQAIRRLYTQLRHAYEGAQQLDSAYHYLRLSEEVQKDMPSERELSTQLVRLIDEFQREKTNNAQAQARLEMENKLQRQQLLLWTTSAILVLILSLLLLLWNNFKSKKRTNALLQQQKTSLEQSNRRLERFATGVSHDILTNLNLMLSTGHLLTDRADQKMDSYKNFHVQSMEMLKKTKQYCQELLRSAKQTGTVPATIDAKLVLDELLAQKQSLLKQYAIRTRTDFATLPLPISSGDVAQIFNNLINNSIHYLRDVPDAEIVITTATRQGRLAIGVLDNGPGIDETLAEEIFRAHYSEKGGLHGTGLAIVQSIVKSYGGRVWAESGKQKGLEIWFTLGITQKI